VVAVQTAIVLMMGAGELFIQSKISFSHRRSTFSLHVQGVC
jgi:hypothetical protein